jgi:hypothetical protein
VILPAKIGRERDGKGMGKGWERDGKEPGSSVR